ncbi:MAG: VWA domain-containing protein [Saprospiraceae bacterium]|nr:VWA domain-containing protein [Saprospiraceae bacterium]
MKTLFSLSWILILAFGSMNCGLNAGTSKGENSEAQANVLTPLTASATLPNPSESSKNIQVALLLDTSNSMDGLIEQAKSRLWNIVNTLTTLKYNGKSPEISISLYEYGNDGLSENSGYIRQVTTLTQDLDLISEKLFALRTNGGNEYCGAVISEANQALKWEDGSASMKLMYIAGNEPFDQGSTHYKEAISDARKKDIYINTIFCGLRDEGVRTHWKSGAEIGEGKYFNINPDNKVRYIETPYDARIDELNMDLNNTYYGYGALGNAKKENQLLQDTNASSISESNKVNRAISKSKANAYSNETWDVVDRVRKDNEFLRQAADSELPEEMQGMTLEEKEAFVAEKAKERKAIQKEMEALAGKRQKYIDKAMKASGDAAVDDLGKAIETSIVELGALNGFRK